MIYISDSNLKHREAFNKPLNNTLDNLRKDSAFLPAYREVAHTHGILEETLKAGGPAGHTLLRSASVACSWKTAITVQAALAAAALQLDPTIVCETGERSAKVREH